jgi:hypothetical protein
VSAQPLFAEPATPRTRPLGSIEPAVHWLSESTRPEAAAARATVNAWYGEFRDPDGKFAARLRSEDTVEHLTAVDELHVQHQLQHRHADVRYEEGGVGPDFRVYENGKCIAGVEVLSLFQPADWSTEERQHGRIVAEINARVQPTAGYFVDLDVEQADRDPVPTRMERFIRATLAELPPPGDLMKRLPARPRGTDLPVRVYEEDGVRIRLRFIPMRPDAAARTDPDARIVGTGPIIGGIVTTSERMKERIASKAGGRYDIADAPFTVAVCLHDTFADDHEVLSALYGGEAVTVPSGQLMRRNDGLFGVDKNRPTGRHRRVSAIIVVNWLKLWDPDAVDVAILHNPYAERPWPDDALPARRRFAPVSVKGTTLRLAWS